MLHLINDLNFYVNYKLISIEEIIVIFLFYNFIKIIVFSSLFELIWPTQFFNKRHSNSFFKYRTFTEVFLKLKKNNRLINTFNLYFIKCFLLIK